MANPPRTRPSPWGTRPNRSMCPSRMRLSVIRRPYSLILAGESPESVEVHQIGHDPLVAEKFQQLPDDLGLREEAEVRGVGGRGARWP